ncbi:outer membrane protein assembly factor BamA [Marinilabilia rubra]|uniref:Outer membrane protein assembly factor BamA n=1 Tax=Marinilabilia rubra TaxID=2162893 RepID=A0A2U2B9T5_9BACT|nr:outer membrane protein assembly factor BamA [Marinilabilia rubra]PWD99835.1 outer membrane protein assembly factor BamA [Marinilabilia rubra]
MLERSFVLYLLTILSFIGIKAQESTPEISYSGKPQNYIIADIKVTGDLNNDPKILANLSGLKVGQEIQVPGEDISDAIDKYWEYGLFSDIKISADKIEGNKIYLNIYLQERPRLTDINFSGLKKSEIDDISGKISMMRGSQVTPYLVDRAEKYIKQHFVDKGFFNTEVSIVQRDDADTPNHVYLDITVDKKDKVKVNSLEFYGNDVFSDYKLNRFMKKTNEKGKILNFFRTKKFVSEEYENDLKTVIEKYNEEGYRDAYIEYDSISRNSDNTVDIKIGLSEGSKYYFGDISWVGNTVYPGPYLSEKLRIKKGDVFNQTLLDERLFIDDDAVHNLYMNDGYLFSNIEPVDIKIYNDTVDLEMRVYEGQQATIDEVIIKGNTKTHEHVVRRELRTKPGELFDKSELIRTVRELSQLGHFDPENINPVPIPDPEKGTVDLEYNLVEKANDQIELSGGWGGGMFVGSLGLKFTNFSVRNIFNKEAWRPLPTGDGQTLSLRAQTNGKYYQSYSFSFTEPWLGGRKPNSLSVSVYHSIQTGTNSSYYYGNPYSSGMGSYGGYGGYGGGYGNYYQPPMEEDPDEHMKVTGLSVGFGKRLSWPDDFFQFYTQASYQRYDLKNWVYFLMENGNSNNLNFKVMLSRNSIDNPLYTRHGSNFSLGLEFTPPYSYFDDQDFSDPDMPDSERYKWVEYHKWTFKGNVFKPLDNASKLVLMTKVEGGFLGYFDENRKSPFEKFVLGGDGMSGYSYYGSETIGLRGYENASLTPYNEEGRQDGNIYNKLALEMRYPLTLQPSATVYGLLFAEAGNSWSDFRDYNPFGLKRSAGVGVRIFLPIFGLMGIDWAYGFDEVPGRPNASGSNFHFVIGQNF